MSEGKGGKKIRGKRDQIIWGLVRFCKDLGFTEGALGSKGGQKWEMMGS